MRVDKTDNIDHAANISRIIQFFISFHADMYELHQRYCCWWRNTMLVRNMAFESQRACQT